jgi:hypothetical protein
MSDNASEKNSGPPKLPDFRASSIAPSFAPTARSTGTPAAISAPTRNRESASGRPPRRSAATSSGVALEAISTGVISEALLRRSRFKAVNRTPAYRFDTDPGLTPNLALNRRAKCDESEKPWRSAISVMFVPPLLDNSAS